MPTDMWRSTTLGAVLLFRDSESEALGELEQGGLAG